MINIKNKYTSIKGFAVLILIYSTFAVPQLSRAYIAQDDSSGYYFKIGLGRNKATSPRNYYKKNLGNSSSLNVGYGGNLISNNRLEINYIKRGGFKYVGVDNSNLFIQEQVLAAIKSETIMLNLYSDQYVTETFAPYFGFGVGYTKNQVNFSRLTSIMNKAVRKTNSATMKSFSWQAVVGANLAIHKRISFDISYRYSHLGKLPAPITHVNRNKSSSKLKNQEILFSILFKL